MNFHFRSFCIALMFVAFGSLWLFSRQAQAATCSVTTDTVITQAWVDTGLGEGACTDIEINGSVSTTWIGTVDLNGAGTGTVTVLPGKTMTMGTSSQMVLGATDDVVVASTAVITHGISDPTGVHIEARNITVTGNIDASGKGCVGGNKDAGIPAFGPNLTTGICTVSTSGFGKNNFGGGAHGGTSAVVSGWPGTDQTTTYGTSTLPTFLGAGGGKGNDTYGGSGGGRIHLVATGILTVDGLVKANPGAAGTFGGAGGGAGGSVYVNAGTLTGGGSILASGGDGTGPGAGGGGGRIAVYYGTLGSFSLGNVLTAGGSGGASSGPSGTKGTTFILDRTTDDGAGNLRVTSGLDFIAGGDYTRDTITIDSQARLYCGSPTSLEISGTTVLMNAVSFSCASALTSLTVSSTQPLQMSSSTISFTGSISNALFIGGEGIYSTSTTLTLSGADLVTFGATSTWQNTSSTISITKDGSRTVLQIPTVATFTNVSLTSGGAAADADSRLTIPDGMTLGLVGSSIYANVSSTFASLTIDATSSIDATGKGCIGGRISSGTHAYGPDLTTGVCTIATSGYGHHSYGGGAHGGAGGGFSDWGAIAQTTTYGSSTLPILLGSGGGRPNEGFGGGNGGGRLHLIVTGTLTIGGSIKSNGGIAQATGSGGGGGSGGSIYIRAAALAGGGSILVSGGSAVINGGGGGGGRIALYYGSLGAFSLSNISSLAGSGAGATGLSGSAGTTYTFQTNLAPDAPTLLGQPSLVDGSTTSTVTPTFSFTLNDPDDTDDVKYQIQIDDSADLGSPIIDYTSILAVQGEQSFQVGQAGSYAEGDGITLSNGSYYWQVKAIDENAAASSYEAANAGAIAFVIDTTSRYLSFESVTGSGLESVTATSIRILLDVAHFENVTTTYSIITVSTTAEGTGIDYTLATGEAVIVAGETSTTISLVIVDDDIDEPNEDIGILLSSPMNALIGSNTSTLYTILDNDTAGVTITESDGSTAVTEADATDSFTVVLTSQPTSTVQVAFATSTEGVTLSAMSLSFTELNWSAPQAVTVTATDDSIAQGAHTGTITPTLVTTAYGYPDVIFTPLVATVADNDTAGITVTESVGSTAVTEGGATDSFTVVLTSQPTSTVQITFTTSTEGVTLSAMSLNFTSENWSTPQTVTATAVNDFIAQGDHTGTVTFTVLSTATGYATASPSPIVVAITDNDVAGVTMTESVGSTVVAEGGATDSFTVVLTSQPTSTVQIAFTTSTEGVTLSAMALNFTSENWSTPQTVTVTAVNDDMAQGMHSATIASAVVSSATGYGGLSLGDITATVTDNDVAGVTVSAVSGTTLEGATTATYTIQLDSQPTSTVVIAIETTSTRITTDVSSVTFTSANWSTPQTITVTPVDDVISQPTEYASLLHTITSEAVTGYPVSLPIDSRTVTVNDDDIAGITLTELGGSTAVTEGGTTDTFTVVLDSEPMSAIRIDFTTSTFDIALSHAQLNFDSTNWSTPQTVTVTATNDQVNQGTRSSTITPAVVTSAFGYTDLVLTPFAATVTDNDTAGVSIVASSDTTVVAEGGATDSFTVVLTSQPTSTVRVALATSTEGFVLSTDELTFTSSDWETPQTVTVTAVDDAVAQGARVGTITPTVISTAYGYVALSLSTVSVTISDDDATGVTVTASGGITAMTEGGTDTYSLVLLSEPFSDVVIELSPSESDQLTPSPSTLIFTSSDWNVPQTVTVTAIDDVIDEPAMTYQIMQTVSSSDLGYDAFALAPVNAQITDNDVGGVTFAGIEAIDTTEGGALDYFTTVLDTRPTTTVELNFSVTAGTVTLSQESLTFTPSNWNVPQYVTTTAVNDLVYQGSHTGTITPSILTTAFGYTALSLETFVANVADDDVPGVDFVGASGLVATEGGTTDSFQVLLTSQPTSTVEVLFATTTRGVTLSLAGLTFDEVTWNTPQTVTVTATDDAMYEGSHAGTIGVTVSSLAYGYTALSVPDQTVAITDNDEVGITPTDLAGIATLAEGDTGTYEIVLTSQPEADVRVTFLPSDVAQIGVSTSTLIFTASNWNVPQSIIITPVNDLVDEPITTYAISQTVSSGDSNYDGYALAPLSIEVTDNDTAGVTFSLTHDPLLTTEGGATDTFTAVLTSQPTSTVQLSFATTTNGVLLSPGTLIFAPENWNNPQTILVTAVDDVLYESMHMATLTPTVAATAYGFVDLSLAPLTVDLTDNDSSAILVSSSMVTITEGGEATYTLALAAAPTSSVQILLTSDPMIGLHLQLFTFDADNWSVPQTVMITTVNDRINMGTREAFIFATVSSTTTFATAAVPTTTVQILDDEGSSSGSSGGGGGGTSGGSASGSAGGAISSIGTVVSPPVSIPPTPKDEPIIIVVPAVPTEPIAVAPTTPDAKPSVIVPILDPTDVLSLVEASTASRDFTREAKNLSSIRSDAKEFKAKLSDEEALSLTNFITYGISEKTRLLGEGERRAVVRDALETMKTSHIDPADLERMTRGIIPHYRNLTAERQQLPRVRTTFKVIFGHDPNFKDATENLAWNTLMYRMRFPRDLGAERAGILEFKRVFKKNPKEPFQWATVRVLGYVQQEP